MLLRYGIIDAGYQNVLRVKDAVTFKVFFIFGSVKVAKVDIRQVKILLKQFLFEKVGLFFKD